LRDYGVYADCDNFPALQDDQGTVYSSADIIEVLECQASQNCNCEIYTVKIPSSGAFCASIRFISKEGHKGHEDNVKSDLIEEVLKKDQRLRGYCGKVDTAKAEIARLYPWKKGKSIFKGLN
jgi:hypothetical protein